MKIRYHKRCAGILLLLTILLPNILIFPSVATTPVVYDNYESEISAGVRNIYNQSSSAFQHVQEMLNLTNSKLRIILGVNFNYSTNGDSQIRIEAIDNSSNLLISSQNLTIYNSSNVNTQYNYYFPNNSYLLSRGSHLIRLLGLNSTPVGIHYTNENGSSYYCNETTTYGNYTLDSKQYFIQFIEEDVVNLTSVENKSGQIDYPTHKDAIDAYLLSLPANPVKIVIEIDTSGENLNLELYNYTNNGDMLLTNSNVTTTGNYDPEIITYIPSSPGYNILLVKPADINNDVSNYTVYWINSSNQITVTRPVVNFENSTMTLNITGVYASMDGFYYNGTSYPPELAQYAIYREVDDVDMGRNGTLSASGGGEWRNTSIVVSGLNPGSYYVKTFFKDNNGMASGISPKSNLFFVLGNLSISAANISYIGGMTQKINITDISVDNSSVVDVFTYTIFDNELQANTSINGNLNYDSSSQTWNASNIDVSTLTEGTYFVVGYFEDQNKTGIGDILSPNLTLFTINHTISITNISSPLYVGNTTQIVNIEIQANTSYRGSGVGMPIEDNANATVLCTIVDNSSGQLTQTTGLATWNAQSSSWKVNLSTSNLPEGYYYYIMVNFSVISNLYNDSKVGNSTTFTIEHSIEITRPVIDFNNSLMTLDITGVYANMDGVPYNGISNTPENANYSIYREVNNLNIGRNGTLSDGDGDGEWRNTDINISGLTAGVYYIRAIFQDNNGTTTGISLKSDHFFVLGNLSVSAANISYIGGMTQKINITVITVDNTSKLDVFTYTIFDNELKANTTISGSLVYDSNSNTWNASNVDVSNLTEGTYFVVGYFEDQNKTGIGDILSPDLTLFTINHTIEITQILLNYTNSMAQVLEIGVLAKTSFQGHGIGKLLLANEAIASFQIYNSTNNYTGLSGDLTWSGTAWNTSINVADLIEGNYYVQVIVVNNSQVYNASGTLKSSIFFIDHIIDITNISSPLYVDDTTQIVIVEIQANTSYRGSGVGIPIEDNANATVLCTIVDNSLHELTQITDFATWDNSFSSWKVNLPTSSLPEGDYYIMVNFIVISNQYTATTTDNSTLFTISHVLTLYVPIPIFHPDNATIDIVGIIATNSYSGYHHINDTTVKSTYFEIFNYTSKISINISGNLTYNPTNDDWRNMSVDLSFYPEGLYFIRVNISSIDVPEGAVANSSPFELVHKLIIDTPDLDYNDGFQQTLSIIVRSVNSTYKAHTRENISYYSYRLHFRENKTVVTTPNLSGNLTKTISNWQALVNVSKLPEGEYYIVVNFADPTAANSKGSADTTNFTVIHTINMSTPIISYINNMNQLLNISCYANSSYYYHRFFNSSDFGDGYYQIYSDDGTPTSITSILEWNGESWAVINADVSFLSAGNYRIGCYISSDYAEANSTLSINFSITHTIIISSPTVSFDNETKRLSILHVTARSSYSVYGYLTNLTALTFRFEIFDITNQSTGISGELNWNGTEWQVINFAATSLEEGSYYVMIYFNDTQTGLAEISSEIFVVIYPKKGVDWGIIAIILLVAFAVIIVLFWTFFTETPAERETETQME